MTLTRATLGNRAKRKTTDITIDGDHVRLQKPTPLEYSQYQMGLADSDGKPNIGKFPAAILLLTARMWIDENGDRLFSDKETKELDAIDNDFYQELSAACQKYASPGASSALGESEPTTVSDSPAESASNSE